MLSLSPIEIDGANYLLLLKRRQAQHNLFFSKKNCFLSCLP
jgi:hypothetical protein